MLERRLQTLTQADEFGRVGSTLGIVGYLYSYITVSDGKLGG
jgi:hypothetical protein